MNSKQLQYFLELSQILNFSQVAENLNISQPALSKQILSLEEELGVKLFDRSTTPLTLTQAGECFLTEAKEFLVKEDRLKHCVDDFKSDDKGRLIIGISPFRCAYMIPDVVKNLRNRFPGLQIILKEAGTAQLHKGANEGQFDFAVVNLPVDNLLLDTVLLNPEKLVLAVPKSFNNLPSKNGGEGFPAVNLNDCGDIPFIVLSKQQELRQAFDRICLAENFRPEICAEVVGIITAWALVREGVGAAIMPLSFVQNNLNCEEVAFYSLSNNAPVRQPAVIYPKGRKLSRYAEYAIELLQKRNK